MTGNPFDDLERQLRRRTTMRAAPRRSRWRRSLIAAGAIALGTAGAAATAVALSGPGDKERAGRLVARSMHATALDRSCQPATTSRAGTVRFTDAAPPAELFEAMPWLRRAETPAQLARVKRVVEDFPLRREDARILSSSIGLTRITPDLEILVWVEQGAGMFRARDPERCLDVRRAALEPRLGSESDAVAALARKHLLAQASTNEDALQIYKLQLTDSGVGGGGGQLSPNDPVQPAGWPFRPGLQSSGSVRTKDGRASSYLGLATPGTARMRVEAARPQTARRLPRTVAVRDGFWHFEVPFGYGAVTLVEERRDGSDGRRVELRR